MFKILLCLGAALISAYGSGEITFLHHPRSISFKGHDHIKESLLAEVYSAALGFSIEQDFNWQGMYLRDPFNLAEAIVTVAVDGVTDLGEGKGHHFPLRTDEDESETYYELKRRIEEHNFGEASQTVRIELSDGLEGLQEYDAFKSIKTVKPQESTYGNLKKNFVDEEFLNEVAILHAIADKIESGTLKGDFIPDVFWFKVSGLHTISDVHGENSTATKEAKKILSEAIRKLNDAFLKAYSGRVLFSIIASDASHTRRVREADAFGDAVKDQEPANLAKNYQEEYPAIFNIILWFGVAMFFSLLAICIFISTMDPGRDSIIYRMTSTRMKKDN